MHAHRREGGGGGASPKREVDAKPGNRHRTRSEISLFSPSTHQLYSNYSNNIPAPMTAGPGYFPQVHSDRSSSWDNYLKGSEEVEDAPPEETYRREHQLMSYLVRGKNK